MCAPTESCTRGPARRHAFGAGHLALSHPVVNYQTETHNRFGVRTIRTRTRFSSTVACAAPKPSNHVGRAPPSQRILTGSPVINVGRSRRRSWRRASLGLRVATLSHNETPTTWPRRPAAAFDRTPSAGRVDQESNEHQLQRRWKAKIKLSPKPFSMLATCSFLEGYFKITCLKLEFLSDILIFMSLSILIIFAIWQFKIFFKFV